MNEHRDATLATGWRRIKATVAFPAWFVAALASIPPLAILYLCSKTMDWAEAALPAVFNGEEKT